MRNIFSQLIFCITMLLTIGPLQAAENEIDLMNRGIAAADSIYYNGNIDKALEEYRDLLIRYDLPKEIEWPLFQRIGLALSDLGDAEQALEYLEQAAIWAPMVPENHRNLATLLIRMGRTGRAISEIREACDLDPGNWQLKLECSQMMLLIGQVDAAKALIKEAENGCYDTNQINHAWAKFYLDLEDYSRAQPYLEDIMRVKPTSEIRNQLALALLRNGQPESCSDLLMTQWPDNLDTQGIRILLEADLATGGKSGGLEIVESLVINGDPQAGSDFWATAALVSLDGGAYKDALVLIDRAIAILPQDIRYRHNRVVILKRLGREAEAAMEMETIRELDPSWNP